jgi:RNA polymerase sigma-70 factor (ECF subfamily)
MTHSPDLADDLMQDTYLKAFASITRFNGKSAFTTWLYRIAVNEALQERRRKKPAKSNGNPGGLPDTSEDGRQVQLRLEIDEAMAILEPMDRAMLLLRYQEGLDYRAIAEVVNCPMGTVASRLNRARQRLREIMGDPGVVCEETPAAVHPITGNKERETSPVLGLKVPERRSE